jgi:hypothetical protein
MSTSLIDSANTGLLTRAFVFAACLSTAASLAGAAHATTTLPPLPDVSAQSVSSIPDAVWSATAIVIVDNGKVTQTGGPGSAGAHNTGTAGGVDYNVGASVKGIGGSTTSNGNVELGSVSAGVFAGDGGSTAQAEGRFRP